MFTMPNSVKELLSSWDVGGVKKPLRKIWNTIAACLCWVVSGKECKMFQRESRCYAEDQIQMFMAFSFLVQPTRCQR